MNTPHRPTREPDDQDIAALFDAQSAAAPDALDARLLEAAKQAVTAASAVSESKPAIRPLSRTSNRWFALAATVVVGISVAPLLLKSPESSLDAPMATAPLAEDNFSKGGAAGDLLLEESDTLPVASTEAVPSTADHAALQEAESEAAGEQAVMKTTQSLSARSLSTNAAALRPADAQRVLNETGVDDNYRDDADAWIEEILRLKSVGNKLQVSVEYALFRAKHPDFKPEFTRRSLMDESATDEKP